MTSAKTVQYIKRNEKSQPNSSTDNDSEKGEDNFSLKLNPGRPNLDAVSKPWFEFRLIF